MIAAIRALKPPTVVIENVANLVSFQGGRLFRTILDDLRAAGYAARWAVAGACTAWACHHRHRVFILARLVGRDAPPAIRVDMPTCGPTPIHLLPTPCATDQRGACLHGEGGPNLRTAVTLLPTPRATDGTKGGPNQRGSSGDLMLPSAVMHYLPTPTASDSEAGRNATAGRRNPKATTNTNGWTLSDVAYTERWGKYAAAIARWAALHGPPPEPVEPNRNGNWRLAAPFPEWMMGLTPGWVSDLCSRNHALRLIGNGVMPQHGGHVLGLLRADEEAPSDLFGLLAVS